MTAPTYYSTRDAARRVARCVRTIRYWRRHGMPVRFTRGYMEIEESDLLEWYRRKLVAHPAHPYRLRRALAESAPAQATRR